MARENGYSTQKRLMILDYLKEHSDKDVSVRDIENHINNNSDKKINITTIYRYLDKLENNGQVLKHMDANGKKASFQYIVPNTECHSHLHLKCSKCETIYHLDCDFMDDFKQHIFSHHKFLLECSSSMLYGLCEKCRKQV